ncbi:MAG: hypothetical protein RMI94_08555 [Bryobacterales bacterium]|nr:hypothetical protein [Bryobacterales bacterium]
MRRPGLTEVEYQASNQHHFHWLSGDDVPQSLIHNLDRASSVLHEAAPLKCHGMGGRSTLRGEIYGNVFDHHAVVYQFPHGVHLYAFCRTIPNCYDETSSRVFRSKGRASLLEMRIEGETRWQYAGPKANPNDLEHVALFEAVRSGKPIHNGDYTVRSPLIAVMGQIGCYTGEEITSKRIKQSDLNYPPKPEEVHKDMDPPVRPDAEGVYPVFVPGGTKLL